MINIEEFWTLEGSGGVFSAPQAGVTDIVRKRGSLRTDTCTLRLEGRAFDGGPLFPFGSTVTVRRGGSPWFVGRVTGAPGSGDGTQEGSELVLSGPWWYLENLVCQQRWTLRGGAGTSLLSRLVLGQAEDGTRLTSGQVIVQTLQYAIDAGAPFQIGVVEPDIILPLDELRNVTCAQVIRRVLRWHPDCVAWFDHGTAPWPTFHCRARAGLPGVTIRVGQAPLAAVRGITARPDLLVPAVVLHYETRGSDGIDVLTDAAPPAATGREFGALVATISGSAGGEDGAADATGEGFASVADLPVRGPGAGGSLAQALLAARAEVAYSGSVVLVEDEAGEGAAGGGSGLGVGSVLNLAGDARAEWASMRALVLGDETRVAEGTTVVRFGVTEEEAELSSAEVAALATALLAVQPGVVGREAGSPAVGATPGSVARVSGRAG